MEAGDTVHLFQGSKKHRGLDTLSPRRQGDKGVCQTWFEEGESIQLVQKIPIPEWPRVILGSPMVFMQPFPLENGHSNSLFLGRPWFGWGRRTGRCSTGEVADSQEPSSIMTLSLDEAGWKRHGEGVGAAACCRPRWQRGQNWPRARAAACLRPSPPPEPSHFLCAADREREPGAVQARTVAVALARKPATIATPTAASRAMDLPRGLLVAWTLSLWPGTFTPRLPLLPGAPPWSSRTSTPTALQLRGER